MDVPGSTLVAPPESGRLRVAVLASLAGKAGEMATLLLLATVLPRVLGPTDYGHLAVPLTVVTIGSLALTLGGPTVMARFVPAAVPEERAALALAIGARLARGRAAQLTVLTAVALAAVVWDPARFPPLQTALVSAALALNVAATLALQVTLGLGRAGAWSLRYPLQNAVLIVAVLLLHPAAGATGAVVAILVAAAAAAALGASVVAPIVGVTRPEVAVPVGALRFGGLQAAGAALMQVVHRGGVVAVALLAGSTSQTGHAALAIGVALGVTYAVLQAFTVSLPHLAGRSGRAWGPADTAGPAAEAVLRRLAGGLLVVIVPAAALVALTLDAVVPTVFGGDYAGASSAFGPVLGVMVLAPLNALAVQAAALRLQPGVSLAIGLAAALGFLVTAVVAVPSWGAPGGTAAALVGTAAGALVSLWMLPGAVGGRIGAASFAGAVLVVVLAVAT